MFKKPFELKVDDVNVTVNHDINITATTYSRSLHVIEQAGKTAIAVIVVAALAKTSSDVISHIVKTAIV
jgi:hypothetical protein